MTDRGKKIIFIRPNSKRQNYGMLDELKMTAIEPPLWPALLAGYCRSLGYKVDIIDAESEGFSNKVIGILIEELKPDLAVICVCGHNPSASTQSMNGVKELVELLNRGSYIPQIAIHGLHPSALPFETLEETKADAIIVGEGFDIIKEDIFWEGIYRSQQLIDLTTLPQPAWDLLPIEKYRAHNWHCFGHINKRSPYGLVYTALGCTRNCSFCVIHTMTNNQRKWRNRTIEQIIADFDFWVTHGVTNIRIVDEDFTLVKKHCVAVCKAITARYGDNLNIWAYANPTAVDAELLEIMRRAGVKWLCYGFEAADLEEKGKFWEDTIYQVTMATKVHDININANWIFGLPTDNWFRMQHTLHVAQEINAEWANFYCAMAYPGSKLYEIAKKKNWPLPDTWEGYSQYSKASLPLPTNYLTPKEVLTYRDYAFKTYFSNPVYLQNIMKKFGMETVEYIQKMLSVNLR